MKNRRQFSAKRPTFAGGAVPWGGEGGLQVPAWEQGEASNRDQGSVDEWRLVRSVRLSERVPSGGLSGRPRPLARLRVRAGGLSPRPPRHLTRLSLNLDGGLGVTKKDGVQIPRHQPCLAAR